MAKETPPILPDRYTQADFDSLIWEGHNLWGFQVEFSRSLMDWTGWSPGQPPVVIHSVGSELALYIDLWMWESAALPPAWHVPAKLVFHGLTDLKINFDCVDSGFQNAPSGFMIWSIKRQSVKKQKVYLDRPYYSWTVELFAPGTPGGFTFGAYGFTLTPSGKPILSETPPIFQSGPESSAAHGEPS